jgi:ATP-binding protein involved in chromosome partitioning
MTAVTKDQILDALSRVIDPETGKSVTAGNAIQGLTLRDGNIGFAIEVPPARGPHAEPLRKACEQAVSALPGVFSVTAVLTAHNEPPGGARPTSAYQPVPPHQASPAPQGRPGHLRPRHTPVAPMGIPGVNAIIAVASGKGGVGKSTVAVNLALGLSRLGLRTGLLDADIYGPSVPRLLDIREKPQTDGRKLIPIAKLGIKAMSIGFLVTEDQAMIWRGPMVQSALTQMMNDVVWAPLDVLVIDMPPGTGDAQLTIAQRVPLKGAVIVSTPQDIALIDARKGITMFNRTQIPVLGVVENMSVFVCENCGHESHIFGHGGARATAEKLGVPFLGEVPLMPKIRETSDAGNPVSVSAPDGPEAQAFLELARKVAASLQAASKPAPKIVLE